MRRRLYFLLPTTARARQAVDELLLARIDDHHIHVMAKKNIPLGDLPQANVLQRSDLIHGIGVGLGVGGITGILAGLVAIAFPPEGILLGGWTLPAMALAVESGQILMMVDIPRDKVETVTNMIRHHHPEADMHGIEPRIPAFP